MKKGLEKKYIPQCRWEFDSVVLSGIMYLPHWRRIPHNEKKNNEDAVYPGCVRPEGLCYVPTIQ